jgi:hypothetical protein
MRSQLGRQSAALRGTGGCSRLYRQGCRSTRPRQSRQSLAPAVPDICEGATTAGNQEKHGANGESGGRCRLSGDATIYNGFALGSEAAHE